MKIDKVSVSYRKQLSDGRYGTEASDVHLEATLDGDDDAMDCASTLLMQARTRVHADLHMSLSPTVREGVALPRPYLEKPSGDLEELPDFEEIKT